MNTETIAGVSIPDSNLISEATELVLDATNELLFHHSRRVFLFGTLQGRLRGLEPNPELLYIGAMFHDLGLTETYRTTGQRFEVDSADEARRFLSTHGVDEDDVRTVWLSIALHTTPGIPEFLDAEIALVTAGVETDVLGVGYAALEDWQIREVVAAHPRPDFKRRILEAFNDGNCGRPNTTFGNVNSDVLEHFSPGFVRTDFVDLINGSAWPE